MKWPWQPRAPGSRGGYPAAGKTVAELARPPASICAVVVNQAAMEAMLGDIAEAAARLRVQGIQPRAVAIRSGSLHGLETAMGMPVVRLHADSPVEWAVLV